MKIRVALTTALFLLTPVLCAQDPPEAETQAPEPVVIEVPQTVEEAVKRDMADLKEALANQPADQLKTLLAAWMELVEQQSEEVEKAVAAPRGSDAHKELSARRTDRNTLIDGAKAIVAASAKLASDDASLREITEAASAELAALGEQELQDLATAGTLPDDSAAAEKLDLGILRAELRPLTKAQVEKELEAWLALLQKKSLQVRLVEVASMETEEGDQIDQRNQEAVKARTERDALISRVNVVIDSLEAKAGDVKEARAYVDSVVVAPEITGVRAAWATFRAWLVNPEGGLALAGNIALFLGILIGFKLLASVLGRVIDRGLRTVGKTSDLLRSFLVNSVRKVTMLVGVVIALSQLGVNIGPLVAAIGAAGFVIGFALQGTLSNFASGVMIMMYRPFEIGDAVSAAGVVGKVNSMNLVSTTIRTFDNQSIVVPNTKIWGDVITNITANSTRRVDLTFGIGYEDDIGEAKAVLEKVVGANDKVLADPAPVIEVHELGDSSVNFAVRPWVRTDDYWDVYWAITRNVKEAFDEAGISIPFPQQDVHHHGLGPALPPPKSEPDVKLAAPPKAKPKDKPKGKKGKSDPAPADSEAETQEQN